MNKDDKEYFIWNIFLQLINRGFPLGIDEYEALREALRAGFGWSSRRELLEVCTAIWAKSREEQDAIRALFDQFAVPDWRFDLSLEIAENLEQEGTGNLEIIDSQTPRGKIIEQQPEQLQRIEQEPPTTKSYSRLPPLSMIDIPQIPYTHVFLPNYPINFRAVAQAWRRLRRLVRSGPPVELDIEGTLERRSFLGVVSPPVLRARRRNREKLLLLVDRQGSMAPFHDFVGEVCEAIISSGRLKRVGLFYFHDVPIEGADSTLINQLPLEPYPVLDSIITELAPLFNGELFEDPDLEIPLSMKEILETFATNAAIVIVSDGGAARGKYDLLRLLDTVAFLKGVKTYSNRVVWLNPLPAERWQNCSSMELARHIPMFAMDKEGMHQAVNVLRGRPYRLARPV